jgi:hypothetical protein
VPRRPPEPLKLVNLELHRPTVPLALSLLEDFLRQARRERFVGLKIIHGYGSSGVGGDIRLAVQRVLAQRMAEGEIRAFIAGEDFRISNEHTWALLQAHRTLKNDPDLGRGNKGISIVVL